MKSERFLQKVAEEIFVRMYEEASPPARYPDQVKSYEDHYLDSDRQVEIVNEVCRMRHVAGADKRSVSAAVHTGDCPSTTPLYKKERIL